MDIHILTLSINFLVIYFALAIILGVQYRRDEALKAFHWWIIGISLLGGHFLIIFLKHLFSLGIIADVAINYVFVSSSICLYNGFLIFFNQPKRLPNYVLFPIIYVPLTLLFYIFENSLIPWALSSLSVAVFSGFSARLLFVDKTPEYKKIIPILSSGFMFHGLYFLGHGVLLFLKPSILPDLSIDFMEKFSYFVVLISSTLWTFGILLLLNQHGAKRAGENEKFYNLTINTIPDAVLITRLKDGMILKVNQGFSKLTGFSVDKVIGKKTLDIDIWWDHKERQKFVILLSETGIVKNMEFQFRRKNGRPLTGLLSARSINHEDETLIISVVRDVTSRRKMEEKLRENEEKYHFLTENSGHVVWHINKSNRIDYISAVDEAIRGFKREEVVGQAIWNLFKPEGIKLVREKIEHHRQVEQVGNNMNTTRFEIEQKCKNGDWIWTEITAAPHYNKHGELIGYHGISRDISERKYLLEELNRLATTDDLTQLPNRRHFMTLAETEIKRAKRYHHPLSIVLIDFDNLKDINDTFGHLAGDRALTAFAKIVQALIRDVDIIGRFGGDEFLILLPETNAQHAFRVMERINQILSTSPVIFKDDHFKISISAGIANIDEWTDTIEDMIKRADSALYDAKNDGGNIIVLTQK